MSQFNFVDALQVGGASATVVGIMFLAYKAIALIVNHRCRSECCGRFFSLGILWEATTPPSHRHGSMAEAKPYHHLLHGFPLEEKPGDTLSVSSSAHQPLAPAKSKPAVENKSHQSVTGEGRSSRAPSRLSIVLPTVPSSDQTGSH